MWKKTVTKLKVQQYSRMCDIIVTFNQIFRATPIPTKPTSWLDQDSFVFEENPALSFYPRNLRQITMVESNALLGVLARITSNLLCLKKCIQDIPLWIVKLTWSKRLVVQKFRPQMSSFRNSPPIHLLQTSIYSLKCNGESWQIWHECDDPSEHRPFQLSLQAPGPRPKST